MNDGVSGKVIKENSNENLVGADNQNIQLSESHLATTEPETPLQEKTMLERQVVQENGSNGIFSFLMGLPGTILRLPMTAWQKLGDCFWPNSKAKLILDTSFKNRKFSFKEFGRLNDVTANRYCMPHSTIVRYSFKRMHHVCLELLNSGITIDKGEYGKVTIKFTADEIFSVYKKIESYKLKEEEKAYKLYGELGNLIHDKLLNIVSDDYFIKNKNYFVKCKTDIYDLTKSILLLPLVNFNSGLELCTKLMQTTLTGKYEALKLSEQLLSDKGGEPQEHKDLVNQYKALGINFAFGNNELAKEILPAAKFATSIGMKMPLFMAEVMGEGTTILGFSNNLIGVALHNKLINAREFYGFKESHDTFYHEITHHARSAVGALFIDTSLGTENLEDVLRHVFKGHDNIIDAIKSQIGNYALTNYEEYIAKFSSLVLCILECEENPFDYITDGRLWRLYYEFGGPDFAQIINKMTTEKFGCDILRDKKFDMLSGYPSKFGINVDTLKYKKIKVSGMTAVNKNFFILLHAKTILPPPPLGLYYTTENGRLQLKIDNHILPNNQDGKCYDPVFCILTNGPLTLIYAEDSFQPGDKFVPKHFFEALCYTNSDVLQMVNDEFTTQQTPSVITKQSEFDKDATRQNATNSGIISTINSTIGAIVKLPVTAIKLVLGWFSSAKK